MASTGFARAVLKKIRVLLADDHSDMLTIVSRILAHEFDVVGTAKDGKELIRETNRLHPDVLITDISMPLMNGIEAVTVLLESNSTTKVVFLTVHQSADYVRELFAIGALGYVVKSRMTSDLAEAVKAAQIGQVFVSPPIEL